MSNSAIKSVAAAFVKALATVDNTGSAVTNVCNAAHAAYKGETIPAEGIKAIVSNIADARGWKGTTRKVRESECRTVLETYTVLPEAHDTLKPATFTYHDALKLARCLRKAELHIGKAIAAFRKKPPANRAAPVPRDKVAAWMSKYFKAAKPAMREKILRAADIMGITIKGSGADDSDDE